MDELKQCPFCGGKAFIQIRDDEGNLHDEEGYEQNPWSGLSYTIGHYHEENEGCPIAGYKIDGGEMGRVYLYDTREEAIEKWNKRVSEDVEELESKQPYKFEDLKKGMWVWDDVFKEMCFIISVTIGNIIYIEYLESHCSINPYIHMPFEENRFFPVQMANMG